jgi:hypothetical protein
VEEGLALPFTASEIAGLAVPLKLAHVSANGLPALDLPSVLLRESPSHVVPAVPLKPATRVVRMNPPIPAPSRQRQASINTETIQ